MTTKSIQTAFDTYQRARLAFTQSVSDMANRSVHINCILQCDALPLLHPLLKDPSIKVQQSAALAVGKLANGSLEASNEILRRRMLSTLMEDIDKRSKYYKKSSMYTLRSVAKYSEEMAQSVVNMGAIEGILLCLEDFDGGVKEAALLALGIIAKQSTNLAQACVAAGAIPMVKLCLQEPEVCMKQIAAATMGDIVKHDASLAQALCDAGCISHLVRSLSHPSTGLKRQILCTLGHIAKHSMTLAEIVVESDVISDVLLHLAHPDPTVRKNAANLVAELTKHHLQLAQLVVNSGCIGALLEMIASSEGEAIFPAILALGYISSQSDATALAIINAKGVEILAQLFEKDIGDHILAVLAWTLGQIGKHSATHTEAIARLNLFNKLLELYLNPLSSQDLQIKCRVALKQTVRKCLHIPSLELMLQAAPPEILKYVLGQYSQILPRNARARRLFVTSGSLKKVQQIQAEPGSNLMEFINIINHCYPEEIIKYYTPGYSEELMKAVDRFIPTIPPVFIHEHDEPDDADLLDSLNLPQKPEIC